MFFEKLFTFCCSKRDKQENDTQQMEEEPPNEDFNIFVDQQRNSNQKDKNDAKSKESPTSYIISGDNIKPKAGSYERELSNQDQQANFNQFDDNLYKTQYQPPIQKENTFHRSQSTENFQSDQLAVTKKIKKQQGKRTVKIWDQSEDNLLRKYYAEYNGNWHQIAQMIPNRNISQCSQRWRRINPISGKKKWTFEEDQKVISLVRQMGKNWTKIAKELPDRNGKQIRERYLNKLDPGLIQEPWTKKEDQIILDLYKSQGPKWSAISIELKGRSVKEKPQQNILQENQVKNRFYSYIKRVVLGEMNPYQVVHNNMDDKSQESSYGPRNPYSENGSYSSNTTYSLFDEEPFLDDEDMFHEQFMEQAQINDSNHLDIYKV